MTDGTASKRELSEAEKQMLQFMKKNFKYKGARDFAIQREFHLNSIEFFQRLNSLLDTEAALAYDPILVNKLRQARQDPFGSSA